MNAGNIVIQRYVWGHGWTVVGGGHFPRVSDGGVPRRIQIVFHSRLFLGGRVIGGGANPKKQRGKKVALAFILIPSP